MGEATTCDTGMLYGHWLLYWLLYLSFIVDLLERVRLRGKKGNRENQHSVALHFRALLGSEI